MNYIYPPPKTGPYPHKWDLIGNRVIADGDEVLRVGPNLTCLFPYKQEESRHRGSPLETCPEDTGERWELGLPF
jgi:hypothetical protein